jgi:hypothetical protein
MYTVLLFALKISLKIFFKYVYLEMYNKLLMMYHYFHL